MSQSAEDMKRGSWKVTSAAVRGSRHVLSGGDCQDACATYAFETEEGSAVAFALSDGAGSSLYAKEAADRVVSFLLRKVLESNLPLRHVDVEIAQNWFSEAGQHLRSVLKCEHNCLDADLHCTAVMGVFWDAGGFCVQIGDGAIAVRLASGWMAATKPDVGEYASETFFLISPGIVQRRTQFARFEMPVEAVVAFTDGLQPLLLEGGLRIHPPVFESLLRPLSLSHKSADLRPDLEAFLNHPQVIERTDDDKSIVLLLRSLPVHLVEDPSIPLR